MKKLLLITTFISMSWTQSVWSIESIHEAETLAPVMMTQCCAKLVYHPRVDGACAFWGVFNWPTNNCAQHDGVQYFVPCQEAPEQFPFATATLSHEYDGVSCPGTP